VLTLYQYHICLTFYLASCLVALFFLKADGGADSVNDVANTIMHKFWDSAFALDPPEEYDNHRLFLLLIMLVLF
jgi:hypothetical protein